METDFDTKSIMVGDTMYDLQVRLVTSKNYEYQLAMDSVADYRKIIDTIGFDADEFERALVASKTQISIKCPPKDALSKRDLAQLSDTELVKRINEMALFPKKIIYMFAHGYGFRWEFLSDLAEYKGFQNVGATQKPVYIIPENSNTDRISASHVKKIYDLSELAGKEHNYEVRFKIGEIAKTELDYLSSELNRCERGYLMAEIFSSAIHDDFKEMREGYLEIYAERVVQVHEKKLINRRNSL